MNKKIAVLLAAYNGIAWLKEQIETILEQNNVDVIVYISVDISTDVTYAYCLSLSHEYDNIHVLPYGEKFGGAGRNFYRLIKDIEFKNFDYIAFSDQDDIWHQDKLINAIKKLQQYDCYSSNVTAFWEDGRDALIDKAQPQRKWDYIFEAAAPGCTYVFRQDVAIQFKTWLVEHYEQVGDDIALHDWLLYAFARSQGYRWFIDPEPMMLYRQHANNQVGTNNSFGAAKKRLHMIKSKWYRKQCANISEHLALHHLPIVKYGLNKGYIGNLYLIFHINQLRRRLRDRVALSIALFFNLF
ncbi:glycosyl transferase [Aeromonas hydrophila]|uniref:glycosyltransferase n=1 Tax=Aeromonas hydrophila TaxID=644 RepID=UPI00053761C6|nr:glycosyltransferase [Aeromonas hydrophila]KHA55668.1 glycosyl transferase [Aeromonas hydrophila]